MVADLDDKGIKTVGWYEASSKQQIVQALTVQVRVSWNAAPGDDPQTTSDALLSHILVNAMVPSCSCIVGCSQACTSVEEWAEIPRTHFCPTVNQLPTNRYKYLRPEFQPFFCSTVDDICNAQHVFIFDKFYLTISFNL